VTKSFVPQRLQKLVHRTLTRFQVSRVRNKIIAIDNIIKSVYVANLLTSKDTASSGIKDIPSNTITCLGVAKGGQQILLVSIDQTGRDSTLILTSFGVMTMKSLTSTTNNVETE
jgi:hypothetical protein